MRILQVNTNDIDGGAARAAYRIHRGLIENGVLSEMLVQNKKSDDYTVKNTGQSKIGKLINKVVPFADNAIKMMYPKHLRIPWSVNLFNNSIVLNFIRNNECDIVHFHWINNALLSISNISKIRKPVVWTLHDTWAFTGGCHYFGECTHFMTQCKSCNQLTSKSNYDLSSFLFEQKHTSYRKSNITIVTPSKWLADCARQSYLLKNQRIEVIPNGIDLDVYKQIPKAIARDLFNISNDELVIMFGAMNSTSDQRKGYIYLQEAIQKLKDKLDKKIRVVIFGASKPLIEECFGYPTKYTGHVSDDITLSLLYNCADVFVAPSREDNLPNTIVEALACGTPCVAFNIGGMPDMIDHGQNGYLAKAYEAEDLAKGIAFVLEDEDRWRRLSESARRKALQNFDVKLIARRYYQLYKEIIAEDHHK